jgi:hypothetical protein
MKYIAIYAAALIVTACGGGDDPAPAPSPTTHSVEYKVEGFGAGNFADVTYSNMSGGTEQKKLAIPGTISYFAVPNGTFLYISAQNPTSAGGIQVSIKADGRVIKSSTSSGGYVIATASTSCC